MEVTNSNTSENDKTAQGLMSNPAIEKLLEYAKSKSAITWDDIISYLGQEFVNSDDLMEPVLDLLKEIGRKKQDLRDKEGLKIIKEKLANINIKETSKRLNTSEITLKDIIEELSKPGRDPREDMPKQILRSDVLKFEDLKEGMILNGTVRNVIDFGAFVDIGVKHDGLVHISEMSNNYVKNPSEIVSVGDIVKVKVIGIDNEKQKVKLSMKI